MIHIVKCDDPSLLPFARSRLGVLRGMELQHISQKYDVGGVTVRVQKSGEHEYIWIEGGPGSSSPMDSGVVEIFAFNEENPARLLSGILYESSYVSSYTAAYAMHGAKYKEVNYRTNTATDGQQIAGFLHFSGNAFKGWMPEDATEAKSFEREMIEDTTTDPPTLTPDPEQLTLVGKKVSTFIVPASIFTGKCRLWVQAMYGAWNNNGEDSGIWPAWTGFESSVAPALYIPTALRDKTDYGITDMGLLLSTNCGVWLNQATGEHWLIVPPSATTATVFYPLISNASGEAWRKHLITASPDTSRIPNSTLPAEDIAHLEAHILAYCLPDRSLAISVSTPSVFSAKVAQSLSYGWHWNWAGTEAVIVTNESKFYGWDPLDTLRPLTQVESQTSVLGVQASTGEAGETVFAATVVTGNPTRWAIDRRYWTVVHPDFARSQMYKLTDAWVHMTAVDRVVFYAYYTGNTRVECAASIAKQEYEVVTTSSNPNFTWANPLTLGMSDGNIDVQTRLEMFRVRFSVGNYSTPWIPTSAMQTSTQRKSVTDKTRSDVWAGFIVYNYYSTTTIYFDQGDPPYESVALPLPLNTVSVNQGEINGCTVSELVIETALVVGGLVAVIPANDAEAICVRCGNHERDVTSGSIQTYTPNGGDAAQSGGSWHIRDWWQPGYFTYNPDGSRNAVYPQAENRYVNRTNWNLPASGANYTTTTTSATTPPDRIVCDEGYLFAGGRTTDNTDTFLMAMTQTFLNYPLEDTVPVRFGCLSGCGAVDEDSSLIIAPDLGVSEGFTPLPDSTERYVIVGWA